MRLLIIVFVVLLVNSCDAYLDGTRAMQRLSEIEIQKNFGRWGQVECSGDYVCEDNGLCCTQCVNLDDGQPLLRCHDLTPVTIGKILDLYHRVLGEW